MLEKLKGITIQGRCFSDSVDLKLYPKENDRISIIYGKNGSGKSTISEGILGLKSQKETDISVTFLSDSQEIPSVNDIFVFNEDYIAKNIKIEEEGLGTIVLLGGRVDLEEKIAQKKKEKMDMEKELIPIKKDFMKYNDSGNLLCPLYHMENIKRF